MNSPVQITNGEWNQTMIALSENTKAVQEHEDRLDNHGERIKKLEDNTKEMPYAIQKAVSDGMEKVLTKVLEHDRKFQAIELEEVKQRAIKAEKELQAQQERKKYYRKVIAQAIIGCFVTSIVGGILSFYVAVFLNNL